MSNGQKSPCRKRIGGGPLRRIATVTLLLTGLLRVDSSQWLPAPSPAWTPYGTHVGKTARITLQDGSSVDLNTDSRIQVCFSGGRREVVLVHGEALFDVVHHPDWPFALRAGAATIKAAGTKLSVRLREDDATDVLVIEGGVGIDGVRWSKSMRVGYARPMAPFSLTAYAGELISVNSTTVLSRVEVPPTTLRRRTAWTEGWLWFAKEPLPEAVAEFNRYHRQRLVLVDPALGSLEIGGRFRSADLESFIATLEHSFNVRRIAPAVHGTDMDTIYLTARCRRARQQCNWPLVQ
jgi:transmembrane sensor